MQKIYDNDTAFKNDPATIELAKALRKFYKEIPFTEFTVRHVTTTVKALSAQSKECASIVSEDYFNITIAQGTPTTDLTLCADLLEHPVIRLSKCEYDLLATNDQKEGRRLGDFKTYLNMQAAGWFANVSLDMKIDDILKDCIVEDK